MPVDDKRPMEHPSGFHNLLQSGSHVLRTRWTIDPDLGNARTIVCFLVPVQADERSGGCKEQLSCRKALRRHARLECKIIKHILHGPAYGKIDVPVNRKARDDRTTRLCGAGLHDCARKRVLLVSDPEIRDRGFQ
jgi:hypothetical protein